MTVLNIHAQGVSPYSTYGIGSLSPRAIGPNLGLGGTSLAYGTPYHVNPSNPATYGLLSSPIFDAGLIMNSKAIYSDDTYQNNFHSQMSHFAMASPVSKDKTWGIALGLMPYSDVNYDIKVNYSSPDQPMAPHDIVYEGDGGINKVFAGLGKMFYLDSLKNNIFSIGANGSYYFGTIDRSANTNFYENSDYLNTYVSNTELFGEFGGDIGFFLATRIDSSYKASKLLTAEERAEMTPKNLTHFMLGGDIEFGQNVNRKTTYFAGSYVGSNFQSDVNQFDLDTNVYSTSRGEVYIPYQFALGFMLENYNPHSKHLIRFLGDYTYRDWTQYKNENIDQNLNPFWQASVGLEYIPEFYYSYRKTAGLVSKINYRCGFRYTNTYVDVNGENIQDFGISFGLGIPFIGSSYYNKTAAMFNMSVEYGQTGKNEPGLIQERYANIFFGVTLTPTYLDRWFTKRKIN